MDWIERSDGAAGKFACRLVNRRIYEPMNFLESDADVDRAYNSKMAEIFAADFFYPGAGERHVSFDADAPDGGVDFTIMVGGRARTVDVKWTAWPTARKLIVNDGKLDRLPDYLIAVSGREPARFQVRGWCFGAWFKIKSRPTGDRRGGRFVALDDLSPISLLIMQLDTFGLVRAAV